MQQNIFEKNQLGDTPILHMVIRHTVLVNQTYYNLGYHQFFPKKCYPIIPKEVCVYMNLVLLPTFFY